MKQSVKDHFIFSYIKR